jgi:hypothetical protein
LERLGVRFEVSLNGQNPNNIQRVG